MHLFLSLLKSGRKFLKSKVPVFKEHCAKIYVLLFQLPNPSNITTLKTHHKCEIMNCNYLVRASIFDEQEFIFWMEIFEENARSSTGKSA